MIKTDELSANAKGGTELLKGRLHDFLVEKHPEHLENIDFYFSRVRDFDENRHSVYYAHDLPGDPETEHLKTSLYNFDVQVFVSYWQHQQFLEKGYLPDARAYNTVIIPNSINIDYDLKPILNNKFKIGLGRKEYPIKLIYHTTPHRGLAILLPVFKTLYTQLQEQGIYITLDVYSSFEIYGWGSRNQQYQHLFQECIDHPGITYHGTVSNEEVLEALKQSHVFAFPSIWPETSCQLAGTNILTKLGVKNIEDIQIGDEVLSHTGVFRKVTKTFSREYNGKLYGFKPIGVHKTVYFTNEHPLYTGIIHKQKTAKYSKSDTKKIYNTVWKNAEDFNKQTEVLLRVKQHEQNLEYINIYDYMQGEHNLVNELDEITSIRNTYSSYKKVLNRQKITPEFAYILGLMAGDGHASKAGTLTLAHHVSETDNVARFIDFFGGVDKQTSENGGVVTAHNKIWANFIRGTIGVSRDKRVPSFIWDCSFAIQEEFLNGYFAADGHTNKHNRKTIQSISISLIHGATQILTNLGKFATVCETPKVKAYTVSWNDIEQKSKCIKYENLIGLKFREKDKIQQPIDYSGMVYNFEVEVDHSYVTETFVSHNCLALIEAMATGNFCVHSSLGALPETSGGLTHIYPFVPNPEIHVDLFTAHLTKVIKHIAERYDLTKLAKASEYIRNKHSWATVQHKWTELLNQVAPST